MTHPLHALARKLERSSGRIRQKHALEDVLRDRHLADDLGLPHRPHEAKPFGGW